MNNTNSFDFRHFPKARFTLVWLSMQRCHLFDRAAMPAFSFINKVSAPFMKCGQNEALWLLAPCDST